MADHSCCCAIHGCRYADPDCPVSSGSVNQTEPCHHCKNMGLDSVDDINAFLGRIDKACPTCGQKLPRHKVGKSKDHDPETTWDHYETAI